MMIYSQSGGIIVQNIGFRFLRSCAYVLINDLSNYIKQENGDWWV